MKKTLFHRLNTKFRRPQRPLESAQTMSGWGKGAGCMDTCVTVRHQHLRRVWRLVPAGIGLVATAIGCFPAGPLGSDGTLPGQNIEQQVSPAGTQASTWDVNDISVLYPLKTHGSSSEGRLVRLNEGQGLMSEQQFASILSLFRRDFKLDFSDGGQARQMNRLDMWGVTAFRIHSCMQKKVSDPCTPTVNIIAQPIIGNESSTAEFAMHLVFLPPVSSVDLLKDMIRIRNTHASSDITLGKPLGIHPALRRPGGLASPFAQALRDEFLLKHLRHDQLLGIAVAYVEPNRLQPWVFFNTVAKQMDQTFDNSIFVFDPATSVNNCDVTLPRARQICRRDIASGTIRSSEESESVSDSTAGKTPDNKPFMDHFLSLALKTAPQDFDVLKRDRAKWEDVFSHIENPRLIGAAETNCVSCHRPHTDRIRFSKVFELSPAAGPNAFQVASASGCTPGTSVDNATRGVKTFNIRNFGYLHHEAIVSQRVQNETLMVCEQLKKLVR